MKEFNPDQELKIKNFVTDLFTMIDDDPQRLSVQRTPQRVVEAYQEIFAHTGETQFQDYTLFQVEEQSDEVIELNIPFYSICEHHLLPFFGTVDIAYIPDEKNIIGLSKLHRLVEWASQRPAVQENLTNLISEQLNQILKPKGVAVSITARHTCIEMRGAKKTNTLTTTKKFTGLYKTDSSLRTDFLINSNQK